MYILRNLIKKYPREFFLASLAIIVQSVVIFLTFSFANGSVMWLSDSASYFEIAKNFLNYKVFAVNIEWGPEAFRTPLYPLFIAIFYSIIPSLLFIVIIQNIIATITVILVYRIGRLIFNIKTGFLASFLYIFESARLVLTSQLMSEFLFVFFLILFIFFSLKFILHKRILKFYFLSGIFLALAALTRPIAQFLPILIFIFIFFYICKRNNFLHALKPAIIFLVAFILVISPWVIRNGLYFNMWKLSSVGGENLYSYAVVRYLEFKEPNIEKRSKIGLEMRKKFLNHFNLNLEIGGKNWVLQSTRLMEPKYEKYLTNQAIDIIKKDIVGYSIMHILRIPGYFVKSSASRSYGALIHDLKLPSFIFYPFLYYFGMLIWIFMYLVILVSFYLNSKIYFKKIWIHLFLVIILLYFAIFSSIHTDTGRFRQPINPLIFLYFSYSLFLILKNNFNILNVIKEKYVR